jgi:hypothetical protein
MTATLQRWMNMEFILAFSVVLSGGEQTLSVALHIQPKDL